MTKSRQSFSVFMFIVAIIISACGGNSNITPTATLRGAIVPTRIATETPTATHTATNTPTTTMTPTHTSTATSTNTPTTTATPSPTLTSTIDVSLVQSYIDDGDSFVELGSYDRAIDRYSQAIEIDESSVDAYLGRGLAHYFNSNFASALEDFTTTVELDPNYIDAYFNRGLTHLELFNPDAAFDDFSMAIELDPLDFEAYYELAIIHFDRGETDEGLAKLQTALDIEPTYAEAYAARGMIYYADEEYSRALPDLENYVLYAGTDATQELHDMLDDTRNHLATLTPEAGPPTTEIPSPPTNEAPQPGVPQTIAYGEEADGEITLENFGYQYEFEASAGDAIDIQMIANDGTLDPLIVLQNSAGNDIAENDDDPNNSGRDSFLRAFPIPADGTYTILATRFQQDLGSTTGTFTLSLSLSSDVDNLPIPETDGILDFDETVSSVITDESYEVTYEFTANAGDVIDIQMVTIEDSSTLDPFLILQNTDGNRIAENDDDPQGIGRDAYLRAFEIPADGTYTIIATRFQQELGSTTGLFELTLSLFEGDTNSQQNGEPGHLNYGDTYGGEITRDNGSEVHEFEAEAGDIVDIRMQARSGTLDPLLILLDEEGNELVRNDDDEQGIGRNSFIREFEISADGTYTIIATRFQEEIGTTTGQYSLTLDKVVSEA